MFRAVLLDVGGTLLREEPLGTEEDRQAARIARLRATFGADLPWFQALVWEPLEVDRHEGVLHRQDTRAALRAFLRARGFEISAEDAERVRAACCLPGPSIEVPRRGALEALRHARCRGLRVGLVTNVWWRTGEDSRRDWVARGAGEWIDVHVTSIDAGWRKPQPAIFQAALAELGVTAGQAVMVGNSPAADIAPAKRLGMRAVLMRTRSTSGSEVEPDAIIDELTELPPLLDRWS